MVQYLELIEKYKVPLKDCLLIGSSVLVSMGFLEHNNDLEIITTREHCIRISEEVFNKHYDGHSEIVLEDGKLSFGNVLTFTTGLAELTYSIPFEYLEDEKVPTIYGYNCLSLRALRGFYEVLDRDKDKEKLKLIETIIG